MASLEDSEQIKCKPIHNIVKNDLFNIQNCYVISCYIIGFIIISAIVVGLLTIANYW
jgi:hypothetical protein